MNDYYTYAYLREDLSPYYVGKGRGHRAFTNDRRNKPPCLDRIVLLRENMSEKQAFAHEIEMIKTWGRKDLGTGMLRNLTDGGDGTSGWRMSLEHKAKLLLANLGSKRGKEYCAKLSVRKMGNKYRLGSKLGYETIEKMRLANLGKKLSNDHKAKLSLAHLGKKASDEHKAKISLGVIAWWEVKKGMDRTND